MRYCLLFFLLIEVYAVAQTSNVPKIDHYTSGEKELAVFPFDKSQIIVVGSIDTSGHIHLEWPDIELSDFRTGHNVIANGGVFLNSCDETDFEEGNLEGINTLHAGVLYVWNVSHPVGVIVPASSLQVSKSVIQENGKNAVAGSYLIWTYASAKANFRGSCKTENLGGDGKAIQTTKRFDLQLHEGWNLVRIDTEKVLTDKGGYTHPISINISTIEGPPKDINWFLIKL